MTVPHNESKGFFMIAPRVKPLKPRGTVYNISVRMGNGKLGYARLITDILANNQPIRVTLISRIKNTKQMLAKGESDWA